MAIPEDEAERIISGYEDNLSARLGSLVTAGAGMRRADVRVRYAPSPAFQAAASRVPGSPAQIVITGGMLEIVFDAAAIVAAVVPGESGGRLLPRQLSGDEAYRELAHLARAVLAGDPSPATFRPAGQRLELAYVLAASILDFVLAHELQHILLGHVDRSGAEHEPADGKIQLYSWADEMAADAAGLEAVLQARYGGAAAQAAYLGPALFFELVACTYAQHDAAAVAADLAGLDVSRYVTHPPPQARRSALILATHPDGMNARLPDVDLIVELLSAARGAIMPAPTDGETESLRHYADACPAGELDQLMRAGQAVNGLTTLDMGPILARVRADPAWSRGAVARAALGMLGTPLASREAYRIHLGVLALLHSGYYLSIPEPEQQDMAFSGILHACVPDIDLIMEQQARLMYGQIASD